VNSQGFAVDSFAATGVTHALGNIKDDACEAILIQIDFLVIWNLAECTVLILMLDPGLAEDKVVRGLT
jgi:hypothetical protein